MAEEHSRRTFSFADALEFFYLGEVGGEAFFSEMVARESQPENRLKLANLLQLETETKAMLRPSMVAAGVSIQEPPSVQHGGRERAAAPDMTYRAAVTSIRSQIEGRYMALYRQYAEAAEARGVAQEIAICAHMVDHEVGLLEFTRRELAGETLDHVLEPLRSRLRFPL